MFKKLIALMLCLLMIMGVGCSKDNNQESETQSNEVSSSNDNNVKDKVESSNNTVKITFLNSKAEIQEQLEEVAKTFTSETGIELEIIPCQAGQSPFEKMTALYASGNATTLAMMDVGDLPKFKDKMYDLSGEKWINDAMPGSLDVATIDNQLLAFPFAVEGFGLIYNKTAIEDATGKEFDPDSIKTRDDLRNLFEEIEAGGTAPIVVSPLDWSLGAHFSSLAYSIKGKDLAGINDIMDKLKKGELDLQTDPIFNDLMDTFDLFAEYNLDKDDPLAGTYDSGVDAIATGKAAFWFMGNWAWPQINDLSGDNKEFGFIKVPFEGSNSIAAGPTKYVAIDKEQNSEEQIEAALTFLNWLVYEESGQKGLVKDCSIIPAYLNINMAPDDPLAESILEYMSKGNTHSFVLTFPSDYWPEVGAYYQKYLSGYSDREELFNEMEEYWKNIQ